MALNRGCAYREQIGGDAAGRTIVDHLAASRRHSSGDEWRARISRGEVELNGRTALPDARLRPGDRLAWHRPPWDEPDVPLSFAVVHEDRALLAVVKPAGLPTLPAGGFLEHTLLAVVRARYPDARPLHRLGRFTSGLVLFALTSTAASRLSSAWRGRDVLKRYRALGSGVAAVDHADITTPIGLVPHPRLGSIHAAAADGKPSRSEARVLERRADTTLFEVDITTGRPHQIRIHLASIGHPLQGDPLYAAGGGLVAPFPALPGDGGYLLHAERLRLAHPLSGAALDLWAMPPPLLRRAGE